MEQVIPFKNTQVILREYNYDSDPAKIVIHLFDKMNSEEGIRQLKEGDKWFRESIQTRVRLVAEIDGNLVATCNLGGCLGPSPNDQFTLTSVVTAPEYQGTGLSTLLFKFVCEWASQYNARMLLVETWENNIAARKFYEKMGFQQYGQLPKGLINRQGEGYVDEIFYYYNLSESV